MRASTPYSEQPTPPESLANLPPTPFLALSGPIPGIGEVVRHPAEEVLQTYPTTHFTRIPPASEGRKS